MTRLRAEREARIFEHHWAGYRYSSRVVPSATSRMAPLVLVGGGFQRKEAWGRLEKELLRAADIVTVDLPGWGDADALPAAYDADLLAAALLHLLDDLGLDVVNVVGSCSGSPTVYRFAQSHPDRLHRMVLLGPLSSVPLHCRERMERAMELLQQRRMEEFAARMVELVMSQDPKSEVRYGKAISYSLLRRFFGLTDDEAEKHLTITRRMLQHEMISPEPAPGVPALICTGEHDPYTTPALCRGIAAACSDGWFTTLANADHMLTLERYAEVGEIVKRFCAGDPLDGLAYCPVLERVPPATVPFAGSA